MVCVLRIVEIKFIWKELEVAGIHARRTEVEEVEWEQCLVPKVLLSVRLAWSRSRAAKLVSTLSK